MRFLQLIVVFIAALIAHAQKLAVVCKMLITDPNDRAPPSPSPLAALLMFSLNCPNSEAGCTYQNVSISPEKKTDSKRNLWLGNARQLALRDEQTHSK